MPTPRPPLLSDRYDEWREHSPVQRHVLRICSVSLVVLGFMLASDDLARWIVCPFAIALFWLLGPPPIPAPDVRGPEFDFNSVPGRDLFDVVGAAVFASACVLIIVSALYGVALVICRRAVRWHARTRA